MTCPEQPEDYLLYLDANNLYGWAMSQSLPYKDIKFDNQTSVETVLGTADDSETGYIIECDLVFPPELHDKFKEYPPCPENICPEVEWLSDFQKQLLDDKNMKAPTCEKLIPHLFEHKNYCIHYRNLKFVVDLGVKIGAVHNIISFKQKAWLKEYIDFNTTKRKEAKNDFEKDFFKLMNNAVFGKTMENVRNRMSLHMTTDNANAIKWFSKINLKDCKEIDGLYLIEMYKQEIVYDKPIYVGTSILDLSKLCMMEFHYNTIHKEFEGKYNLIYSDTDSMVYRIEHPDIYTWISQNKHHFDLSDALRPDLKDNTNKKVLGKFKDELHSVPMREFIALNPKVYSMNHLSRDKFNNMVMKNCKKCKGVSKSVVKNEITHQDYVTVKTTSKSIKRDVVGIRSFNHQLYTYKQSKTALTAYYDKMVMVNNNDCLPFGYKPN